MSDTPRTDYERKRLWPLEDFDRFHGMTDHAKDMERELNAALKECEELESSMETMAKTVIDRTDKLHAAIVEIAELKAAAAAHMAVCGKEPK